MRHCRIRNQQHPRHRIERLLHETVERSAVFEDIRSLFLSLLTQAQDILRHYEQGFYSDTNAMLSFRRRTTRILNDVRASLRKLGDGSEQRRLLYHADRTEEVIQNVTALSIDDGVIQEQR